MASTCSTAFTLPVTGGYDTGVAGWASQVAADTGVTPVAAPNAPTRSPGAQAHVRTFVADRELPSPPSSATSSRRVGSVASKKSSGSAFRRPGSFLDNLATASMTSSTRKSSTPVRAVARPPRSSAGSVRVPPGLNPCGQGHVSPHPHFEAPHAAMSVSPGDSISAWGGSVASTGHHSARSGHRSVSSRTDAPFSPEENAAFAGMVGYYGPDQGGSLPVSPYTVPHPPSRGTVACPPRHAPDAQPGLENVRESSPAELDSCMRSMSIAPGAPSRPSDRSVRFRDGEEQMSSLHSESSFRSPPTTIAGTDASIEYFADEVAHRVATRLGTVRSNVPVVTGAGATSATHRRSKFIRPAEGSGRLATAVAAYAAGPDGVVFRSKR